MFTSAHPGPSGRSQRATPRSLAPGGPFGVPGGSGPSVGLYYLVCLFRSLISSRPTGDASPSNPGRSVCAFTSASILILISSAAFSSSLSLRFFAPFPARIPDGPSFLPYYFSAFFSRRIERLLRRIARYAAHRPYPFGRVSVVDIANDIHQWCSSISTDFLVVFRNLLYPLLRTVHQ